MFNFLKFQLKKWFLLVFHFTWKKSSGCFPKHPTGGKRHPSCSLAPSHQWCREAGSTVEGDVKYSPMWPLKAPRVPSAIQTPCSVAHVWPLASLDFHSKVTNSVTFFFSHWYSNSSWKPRCQFLFVKQAEVTVGMTTPCWSLPSSTERCMPVFVS